MQFKCFVAIMLWSSPTVVWIAETHFLGQIIQIVVLFDIIVNGLILLNLSPNLD